VIPPDWAIALEAAPEPAMRDAIMKPLRAHNIAAAGESGSTPLVVTVRDAAGEITGGLWGYTFYGYLFVELLAMGEARGQGAGTTVMQLAEAEAVRRGCVGIWLDTFTFQAPGFYQKLGFTEVGRIDDHPPGHARIFYVKRLR
jgi:ribosomal protein S18 acetylase RimI-like enzyme